MMFKKEYDELEKLDLGKSVEVIEISKFTYDNDNTNKIIIDSAIKE